MRGKLNGMSQLTPDDAPNVRQLLAFYLEAGVDCALGEEPINRLADAEPAVRKVVPQQSPAPTPVPLSIDAGRPAAVASAREAARIAPTLEALRALMEKFDGCALKSTATQLVFA